MRARSEAGEIRSSLRRVRQGREARGVRYPAEIRQDVVRFILDREAEGHSRAAAAAVLGLKYQTVRRWLRATVRLRPVAVDRGPAAATKVSVVPAPVLITPSGVRIEGLDLETLTHLVRALG